MKTRIVITFTDGVVANYDDNSILTFNCSENMTDSNLNVTPGVCEQYSEISLYDRSNFLHERAYEGKTDDAKIECYFIDNEGTETILGTYYSSEWNIDGDNKVVKVKGRDKTYILDGVSIPGLDRNGTKTLHQLITLLFQNMHDYAWAYLDEDTRTRCNAISIPNCWFNTSSLRDILDKICYLGMLRIFFLNDIFYVGRSL